jgi:tetratricopeptide repeat protein
MIYSRIGMADLTASEPLVPPTKTFSDRMVLDQGDTTFELYFIGGMHTASDIAILVPEHGLLLTGDTMADVWLNDTPGCLASFVARSGTRHDFPMQIKNWNAILARSDEIKTMVPGHWNGELTHAGFAARVKYIETLWDGAGRIFADGGGITELLTEYRLSERFPELVESPGCNGNNNYVTCVEMWTEVSGQMSAAQAMFRALEQEADQPGLQDILAQFGADDSEYFFMEGEINGHAYRFLQTQRAEQAVAMFRINVDLYPDSWNVYDSLGEGLLALGERDEAIAMYEKALEINPESQPTMEALANIRGQAVVN